MARGLTGAAAVATFIALLAPAGPAFAGEAMTSVSPGLRLGYTFGVGLTVGFDVSVHRRYVDDGKWPILPFGGVAAGVDITYRDLDTFFVRTYANVEAGALFGGVGIGPAYVWGPKSGLTYDVSAFLGMAAATTKCRERLAGAAGALYYRYTPQAFVDDTHEVGLFGKRFYTTLDENPFCD